MSRSPRSVTEIEDIIDDQMTYEEMLALPQNAERQESERRAGLIEQGFLFDPQTGQPLTNAPREFTVQGAFDPETGERIRPSGAGAGARAELGIPRGPPVGRRSAAPPARATYSRDWESMIERIDTDELRSLELQRRTQERRRRAPKDKKRDAGAGAGY